MNPMKFSEMSYTRPDIDALLGQCKALAAKAAGAVTVGLGPRILRCETAPLTALPAAMLLTGNLE